MKFLELMKTADLSEPIKTFEFNGEDIEVKQYISADDRLDLLEAVLNNAYEGGVYNPIKLDVYFHVYLVYLYTNLEFTEEERADEFAVYDMLLLSDLLPRILNAIPSNQYETLYEDMQTLAQDKAKLHGTVAGLLTKVIEDLPKNAQAAREIVDNFDPTKFQEVINFATAANGGRNIFTQMFTTER